MEVLIQPEEARGCGHRRPGADGVGLYLMGSLDRMVWCERLPFPLHVCPCCGGGVKPSRSWTTFQPQIFLDPEETPRCTAGIRDPNEEHDHARCAVCHPALAGEYAGLLWVGEKFYRTPGHFLLEAKRMGISRKVAAIPQGFVLGQTYVYLGHRLCPGLGEGGQPGQGLFLAFRPAHVDLVIDDPDHVPDRALELAKRIGPGARLVKPIAVGQEITETEEW